MAPVRLLGPSLIFMLIYVWSRNFPTSNVSIMGLVSLQAFYLPFALAALSLAMGGDWISDLLGILVGHLCAPDSPLIIMQSHWAGRLHKAWVLMIFGHHCAERRQRHGRIMHYRLC